MFYALIELERYYFCDFLSYCSDKMARRNFNKKFKEINKTFVYNKNKSDIENLNCIIGFFIKNDIKSKYLEYVLDRSEVARKEYFLLKNKRLESKKIEDRKNIFLKTQISRQIKKEENKKMRNKRIKKIKLRGKIIDIPKSWEKYNLFNYNDFQNYVLKEIPKIENAIDIDVRHIETIKQLCFNNQTLDPDFIIQKLTEIIGILKTKLQKMGYENNRI
jgi:hypothetical protein